MSNLIALMTLGPAETVLLAVISVIWFVVPILVVIWFLRKTLENKRENVRLRLEVGKLADELEQVRKQQQAE
jgi:hypothetical protein